MRLGSPLFAGAIAAALMLAGCGGDAGQTDGTRFTRGIGSQPKSMDPQKVEGTWANDVIGDMFIGLFTEDATPSRFRAWRKAGRSRKTS